MPLSIVIRFGNRVRALRLTRGWDQIDLAVNADISRQHVSAIELGKREVCLKTIERIALALEVQPHELLR